MTFDTDELRTVGDDVSGPWCEWAADEIDHLREQLYAAVQLEKMFRSLVKKAREYVAIEAFLTEEYGADPTADRELLAQIDEALESTEDLDEHIPNEDEK